MMNNLINFEIFGENKELFDQIGVIYNWIVVIYWQMCKQIFLIKNVHEKNYRYSLTICFDYIQTIW